MSKHWKVATILALVGALLVWVLLKSRGDISTAEARRLVEQGALLVDVRTPEEYADGHIEGALNIPLSELPNRVDELRGSNVVLYCRSGNRSHAAQQLLKEQGFSEVHNLGAMSRW